MDRAIPEVNKYVAKRQLSLVKALHKDKLKSMQKLVDNKLPTSYYFPINKKNKEQMIEGNKNYLNFVERCAEIEK